MVVYLVSFFIHSFSFHSGHIENISGNYHNLLFNVTKEKSLFPRLIITHCIDCKEIFWVIGIKVNSTGHLMIDSLKNLKLGKIQRMAIKLVRIFYEKVMRQTRGWFIYPSLFIT